MKKIHSCGLRLTQVFRWLEAIGVTQKSFRTGFYQLVSKDMKEINRRMHSQHKLFCTTNQSVTKWMTEYLRSYKASVDEGKFNWKVNFEQFGQKCRRIYKQGGRGRR